MFIFELSMRAFSVSISEKIVLQTENHFRIHNGNWFCEKLGNPVRDPPTMKLQANGSLAKVKNLLLGFCYVAFGYGMK